MNINSIDVTARLTASFMSQNSKTRAANADPATMADKVLQKGLGRNDKDGDNSLSASELKGLSQDTFTTLDADGDGKLNTEELKNAIQTHLEEVRKAVESGDTDTVKSKLAELANTPEGQLLRALKSNGNQDPKKGVTPQVSPSQQMSEILTSMGAQSKDTSAESSLGINLTA